LAGLFVASRSWYPASALPGWFPGLGCLGHTLRPFSLECGEDFEENLGSLLSVKVRRARK
jgi:hypothetical protein